MNMNMRRVPVVMGMLLVLSVPVAWSEQAGVRSYPLPDHGTLQLNVPLSWQGDLQQPPRRLPPTVIFKPKAGAAFQIMLTPIWPMGSQTPRSTADDLRRQVEGAAEHARSQSVEKVIKVNELKGSSGPGYYFSATDRAPKPGEYTYMTQGMSHVGSLVLTFTILTNDGQTQTVADALTMLGSAAQGTQ